MAWVGGVGRTLVMGIGREVAGMDGGSGSGSGIPDAPFSHQSIYLSINSANSKIVKNQSISFSMPLCGIGKLRGTFRPRFSVGASSTIMFVSLMHTDEIACRTVV